MGAPNTYQAQLYNSIEGSLPNASVNAQVAHPLVTEGFFVSIINNDTQNSFTVRFNLNTNDVITVLAGEERTFNGLITTAIFLSNNSGSAINYRIVIAGDNVRGT